MNLWLFWIITIVLLIIVKLTTVNLISIWFIISGILAMFSSFLTDNLLIQLDIFAIGGVLLLIISKPLIDAKKEKEEKENLEKLVGMKGIIKEEVSKTKEGKVQINKELWTALAEKKIIEEKEVVVEKIVDKKLLVKEVKKQGASEKKTAKKIEKKESKK